MATKKQRLRRLMREKGLKAPHVALLLGVTAQYVRLCMCGLRQLSRHQLDLVQNYTLPGRGGHEIKGGDRCQVS